MKKRLSYVALSLVLISMQPSWADELSVPNIASQSGVISKNPKIQKFLKNQATNLISDFPYRMNLFANGQINQNSAGIRIAETQNQLPSNAQGLLFFYELVTNAMRVPHWHSNATEIGTVLEGKMRVTIWEGSGETKVFTVEKNGTWIIPKAKLHSLENVGTDKMKFLVVYDSPVAADRDFVTAWASLPDEILARAVGLTVQDISHIKKTTVNRLSEYDPAAGPEKVDISSPFSNNFNLVKPLYQTKKGSITRVDGQLNTHMGLMALQRTILKPGILRTPHWYTSGDVLLFVQKGTAFFTMMDDEGKVFHSTIRSGDLISIPVGNFHSFLNIGNEDLEVYEAFNRAHDIKEITLKNGVDHFSNGMISGTTGLSKELVQQIVKQKIDDYMLDL